MMPVNVLTLSTIYPNERVDSVGRSVAFLDQTLARLGVKGTTLVLRPWVPGVLAERVTKWHHLAIRNRVVQENGLIVVFEQYPHFPRRYRLDWSARLMAGKVNRLITRHRWRFNLIHGQSIFPSALAAFLVSQHYKMPFIITLRDDLSHLEDMLDQGTSCLRDMVHQMFHHVSAILVHGPAILRAVDQFLPEKRSIPVLLAPNGVDIDGIERILASLPQGLSHSWGHIVSVGNLYRIKGIHETLMALRRLQDRGIRGWRYTVVGEGPYRRELESLAKDSGFGDRVVFTGRLPHREAIRMIHESDIFCLPSWAEPFGNVFAEAAVCGRPAIGCRGFGAELTIKDGETGVLVPPRDVEGLKDALAILLADPERTKQMGRKARDHIRQFTWERTGRLYKETMDKVLSLEPERR
jgi:teichuronic acid biosynthesis glycosyltransferase TuaC